MQIQRQVYQFLQKNKCEYIHKTYANSEHNTSYTKSDNQIDTPETEVKKFINETNNENKKLKEREK